MKARNKSLGQSGEFGHYDVDFLSILKYLWEAKLSILFSGVVGVVLGAVVSYSLENKYTSTATLVIADSDQQGLAGLASAYGGIAALAGISVGGQSSDRLAQATQLAISWYFVRAIIQKYNLKPKIMAVDSWDRINDRLEFNEKLYDPSSNKWVMNGAEGEPSDWDAFKKFSKFLEITVDNKTKLVSISITHYSAELAREWVDLFVKEINLYFRDKDINDARQSIQYLTKKISETSVAEMQSVFYKMIEEQTKKLMLAEVGDEYMLSEVIPATVPQEKSSPSRFLLILAGGMLGGLFGVLLPIFFGMIRIGHEIPHI